MTNTPNRVKIGLGLFIAYLLNGAFPHSEILYTTLTGFVAIVLKEVVCGFLIGFGANLCTSIVAFSGHIADMETGLSMASLFDPTTREQTSITGIYYNYIIMLMLMVSGMYQFLLQALADTFTLIPINGAVFRMDGIVSTMLQFLRDYIIIGFRISTNFCHNNIGQRHFRNTGKSFSAAQHVCGRDPDQDPSRIRRSVSYYRNDAQCRRFYHAANEKNGSFFRGGHGMMLKYNLQFFAKDGPGGEKTEPATAKKLEDARKEGQVAKSKEIANAFGLLMLFLIIRFYIGTVGNSLRNLFDNIYSRMPDAIKLYDGQVPVLTIRDMVFDTMLQLIIMVAPIMLIAFVVAFLCDIVQVKWKISGKPLQPKFSKLNPIKGFGKIFSKNSLVELLKSLAIIGLIGYVSYSFLMDQEDQLYLLYDISIEQAIGLVGQLVTDLGIRISIIYMIIAFADYAYQRWKFSDDMKMTKQEVKDEYKNQEGDPQVKGQIRRRMMQASQRRMMQQLPEADVVITNPTHYAVAIKYDADKYEAPVVLAKGEDYLALKIKEIAKEHHIEIIENKPLARMLYANVEIGGFVPPELYQAVAEVLAMVYHAQGRA